jgi:hypothetical protein
MAVGFHTAGGDQTAFGIDHFGTGSVDGGSHLEDFTVVANEDAAGFQVGTGHGFDVTVFDQKHNMHLLSFLWHNYTMNPERCKKKLHPQR